MIHHENSLMLIKSVSAIVGGSVLYITEPIIAQLTEAPEWVERVGLPIAMLLLAIAGLVGLFKALSAERLARIADRDAFIAKLQADAEKARDSREKLIVATLEQTQEFKRLREDINSQRK